MDGKLSVSQCVNQIKSLLEGEFRNITLEGEITNLTSSSSGHWYFSLSDKDSTISSALFKMDAYRNPMIKRMKNGDKVLCSGSVGVYTKRGTFQIIVRRIVPAGKGDLKEQFEALKRKLSAEGLFDLDRKKAIPELPKKVAIITAEKGAALQDFLNIFKRRSQWMNAMVVPALVQGDAAPASIRKALSKTLESHKKDPIDVIVLTRGGGSLEDLWAFNDEELARDIFQCPIPIISAVGHQVDFSISDFVADLRCETPSSAAEILTERQTSIKDDLINYQQRLISASQMFMARNREDLEEYNPTQLSDKLWQLFQNARQKLEKLNLTYRLVELTGFHEITLRMDDLLGRLKNTLKERLNDYNFKLENNDNLLRTLNPNNVLDRGYSYVIDDNGNVVSTMINFSKLKNGSELKLHFSDGIGEVTKK